MPLPSSHQESQDVHANADDDIDHADADDDFAEHACLSCLGVLATSPTMRSEVAVISPARAKNHSEASPHSSMSNAMRPNLKLQIWAPNLKLQVLARRGLGGHTFRAPHGVSVLYSL